MILRHRDWDEHKELSRTMTVKEFIKEVVLVDENKDKKYYKIGIKESFNGKQNMIIYCQDNKIKSHHSTGIEFDYKQVLDCEIILHYSERTIRVQDILSFDSDSETEQESKYKSKIEKHDKEGTERIIEKIKHEELIKSKRKKVFNDNVTDEDLIICVRQLGRDLQEQNFKYCELEREIDRYKEQEKELQEQIKWLEYRLNNKI